VTAKQQVVIIPENQTEEGIDSYGGKDCEKGKLCTKNKVPIFAEIQKQL